MARTRGSGSIYQQKGSAVWWVKYYQNGRPNRETTKKTDYQEAVDFLKQRLAAITTGTFTGLKTERIEVAELAEDFIRDYRVNRKRSIGHAEARWKQHLEPFFGHVRAVDVTSNLLSRYVDDRQQHGAANATINRELAALKRMMYLGYRSTPPKVNRVPAFPRLAEDNVRTGFLEDTQYAKLLAACSELWFRAIVETGRIYGWRKRELLGLRVGQLDLINRTIRLEPGTTKNREGREVSMTERVYQLLSQCVFAKPGDAFVFTRSDGKAVRDFRMTWAQACIAAGLGRMICTTCRKPTNGECECPADTRRETYHGLIFHDLRRTAARNLRRAGVAEGVIMKIGGWRTRSVFERYAIVAQSDIQDALKKLEKQQYGHSFGHRQPKSRPKQPTKANLTTAPN